MSCVSDPFDEDTGAGEEDSSGVFVWFLPFLWLAGSVIVQLAMAPFASSSASLLTASAIFTLLMVMALIVTLGSDNLTGAGKVEFLAYSIGGWMVGMAVLLWLDTKLYHHSLM